MSLLQKTIILGTFGLAIALPNSSNMSAQAFGLIFTEDTSGYWMVTRITMTNPKGHSSDLDLNTFFNLPPEIFLDATQQDSMACFVWKDGVIWKHQEYTPNKDVFVEKNSLTIRSKDEDGSIVTTVAVKDWGNVANGRASNQLGCHFNLSNTKE